jgi:hypothetical protein
MVRWLPPLLLAATLVGCAPASTPVFDASIASLSPAHASPTPQPTLSPVETKHATITQRPMPTANPLLARYLEGVEVLLRHSAKVLPGQAIGVDDACESRYIIAFPYLEPDRTGGMTLAVVSLERAPDGTVQEGTHTKLWNVRDEGLYPFQWKRMLLYDHSTPGRIQIEYRLQGLEDSAWYIGLVMGNCMEDQLRMTAWFPVSSPDAVLCFTRYRSDAPLDLWLEDSGHLDHYHWEPWTGTLLRSLDLTPGRLVDVDWSEDSPDLDSDGVPDLVISWDIDGQIKQQAYAATDDGFLALSEAH